EPDPRRPPNPARCKRESIRGPAALPGTRRCRSQAEAALDLVVWNGLPPIEFGDPCFDLREEHQALDGVVERRVSRQRLQRLEDARALGLLGHEEILLVIKGTISALPLTATARSGSSGQMRRGFRVT